MQGHFRGQVNDDRAAFAQIKIRLKGDMEPLFSHLNNGYAPMWLIVRGLFPVAESIAQLIYPKEVSSVKK